MKLDIDKEYQKFLADISDITKNLAFVDLLPGVEESLLHSQYAELRGKGFVTPEHLVYVPSGMPYNAEVSDSHFQINFDEMFGVEGLTDYTVNRTRNRRT